MKYCIKQQNLQIKLFGKWEQKSVKIKNYEFCFNVYHFCLVFIFFHYLSLVLTTNCLVYCRNYYFTIP